MKKGFSEHLVFSSVSNPRVNTTHSCTKQKTPTPRRRSEHLREPEQLLLGEDERRLHFNGGGDGLLDDGGEARTGVARRKGSGNLLFQAADSLSGSKDMTQESVFNKDRLHAYLQYYTLHMQMHVIHKCTGFPMPLPLIPCVRG